MILTICRGYGQDFYIKPQLGKSTISLVKRLNFTATDADGNRLDYQLKTRYQRGTNLGLSAGIRYNRIYLDFLGTQCLNSPYQRQYTNSEFVWDLDNFFETVEVSESNDFQWRSLQASIAIDLSSKTIIPYVKFGGFVAFTSQQFEQTKTYENRITHATMSAQNNISYGYQISAGIKTPINDKWHFQVEGGLLKYTYDPSFDYFRYTEQETWHEDLEPSVFEADYPPRLSKSAVFFHFDLNLGIAYYLYTRTPQVKDQSVP